MNSEIFEYHRWLLQKEGKSASHRHRHQHHTDHKQQQIHLDTFAAGPSCRVHRHLSRPKAAVTLRPALDSAPSTPIVDAQQGAALIPARHRLTKQQTFWNPACCVAQIADACLNCGQKLVVVATSVPTTLSTRATCPDKARGQDAVTLPVGEKSPRRFRLCYRGDGKSDRAAGTL